MVGAREIEDTMRTQPIESTKQDSYRLREAEMTIREPCGSDLGPLQ